jgi:tetrahedral aminopeptidase
MDTFELLKELTETPGPSGFETQVAAVVERVWRPLVDSLTIDRVGSLVAVKQGKGEAPRPRLLLAAHYDELGLVVKKVISYPKDDPNGHGFLAITGVGGVDRRQLFGQPVLVHGSGPDRPELPGIIGALPGHLQESEDRDKPYSFDHLVVDVGRPVEELKQLVSVGDFISFRQPLQKLLNGRVAGKALDNRASVAAVTVCLEALQGRQHDWDVIAVATAQEETRLLGAFTSAFAENPDAAIAIDVTFGKGPGATDAGTFELDGGPAVGLGPNVHPGMHRQLQEAAAALEMKVHPDPHSRFSGTDAFGLQVAREGIPTGLLGIPLRYMHTMVESVATADIERVGRLLAEFIVRLDSDFLSKLAKEMMEDEA